MTGGSVPPKDAIHWLDENAPGFRELPARERNAIMHFSLLWSLFEAQALGTQGNAASIIAATRRWADRGLLTAAALEPALTCFRNRYYAGGAFTHHFEHLHLRQIDHPELVKRVLKADDVDLAETAAALLIIIYRFRNNLLHGAKWAYEIRGQFENFTHANTVLMRAIELQNQSPQAG